MNLRSSIINWEWFLSLIVVFLILLVKLYLCFFGVELTDEIFPISMSYAFSKGSLPYIDEINAAQGIAILITPITKIYYYFFQNEAIVLFYRILYFSFTGLIFFSSYLNLRSFINKKILLIILSYIIIDNVYMRNIGYNSITSMLFFFSTILFFRLYCLPPIDKKISSLIQITIGICHGAICIIYPTLSFFLCILFLFYFFVTKEKRVFFLYYTFGFFIVVSYPLIAILKAGLDGVSNILNYANGFNLAGPSSLKGLYFKFSSINKVNVVFIFIFYLLYHNHKSSEEFKEKIFFLLIIILSFSSFIYFIFIKNNFLDLAVYIGFIPVFFVPIFIRNNIIIRRIFFLLWMPAFFATWVIILSSGNGANAAFVLSSSTVIFSFLLIILHLLKDENRFYKKQSKIFVYCGIMCFFAIAMLQFKKPYRENLLNMLNMTIQNGPYKGLKTTQTKAKFLEELTAAIKKIDFNGEKTILFYDRFPAGYLLTTAKPYTPTIWMFQQKSYTPLLNREILINYYIEKNKFPQIVVRMKKVYYDFNQTNVLSYTTSDNLDQFVLSHFQLYVANDNFEIYVDRKNQSNFENVF